MFSIEQPSKVVDVLGVQSSHVEVVSCLEKKKKAVSYREEEVEDCGCIYG